MKTISDFSVKDLLPHGIGADKQVQAAADALDPQLREIGRTADAVSIYTNIGALTHEMLDALAVQFDATNWKDNWKINVKQSVLKTIIVNKRKVGTLKAVREAIGSLGNKARIVEWFNETPKGKPHTFNIYLLFGGNETDITDDIIRAINLAKPARSHFAFIVQESGSTKANTGGGIIPVVFVRFTATATENTEE